MYKEITEESSKQQQVFQQEQIVYKTAQRYSASEKLEYTDTSILMAGFDLSIFHCQ